MIIGIPKEIKDQEGRVSCPPSSAKIFIDHGHQVLVEKDAGFRSGFTDEDYAKVGCEILSDPAEVRERAGLIYKVKEPLESEYKYLREDLIVFTYLHLAANRPLVDALVASGACGVAFETVQIGRSLPLLKPMSEVAGRMSVQEGAKYLTAPEGGKGILLQGVPGVRPANVVIIGAGNVGTGATRIAAGMGARVTVINRNIERLGQILDVFQDRVETLYSNSYNISRAVRDADLVISTVLIPGAKAPQLITREMVKTMQKGSVIVDVAIDQGGSTEITAGRPSTLTDPVFVEEGVTFYAVANMPGAVPRTSTLALSNATTKYALALADLGRKGACQKFPELKKGINIAEGKICYKPVAESHGLDFEELNL